MNAARLAPARLQLTSLQDPESLCGNDLVLRCFLHFSLVRYKAVYAKLIMPRAGTTNNENSGMVCCGGGTSSARLRNKVVNVDPKNVVSVDASSAHD